MNLECRERSVPLYRYPFFNSSTFPREAFLAARCDRPGDGNRPARPESARCGGKLQFPRQSALRPVSVPLNYSFGKFVKLALSKFLPQRSGWKKGGQRVHPDVVDTRLRKINPRWSDSAENSAQRRRRARARDAWWLDNLFVLRPN